MHEPFVYTMQIKHACGAEILVQGAEWPPKVIVCSACQEVLGLSRMQGHEEAKFKTIGITNRQEL